MSEDPRLAARDLSLAYGSARVVHDLNLDVPDGAFTAIVGPNGCGKSTLLRALARLHKPSAGAVALDGRDIHSRPTREVARELGLLPQAPIAPAGITVRDLVARGRTPHLGALTARSRPRAPPRSPTPTCGSRARAPTRAASARCCGPSWACR